MILVVIIITKLIIASPWPTPISGQVFGPGKVGVQVIGRALNDSENNNTIAQDTYTTLDSRGAYVLALPTDNTWAAFWVIVEGNASGKYGFNTTKSKVLAGTNLYLNITLHADLNLTSPENYTRFNFTTPSFNWSYAEEDWINYTIYIDNNMDFSSPIIQEMVHDTNYTVPSTESLANGTYYFKIRSWDINYSIPVDESEVYMFDIDTAAPNITGVSPPNLSWTNTTSLITVYTDENATCKFDNESATPFLSKEWNLTGFGTTHTYLFNFSWQGNHSFYFQCNDTAGNIMNITDEWFHIISFDNISPVSGDNFTLNNTWTQFDQIIELTANDTNPSPGLNWTRYCTGSGCDPEGGTDYTVPVQFTEAITIFRYASADLAGNVEKTHELVIRIDQTPPTTSDDFAFNDTWRNANQIITLTPSDPAPSAGINFTKYCTDNSTCTPNIDYTVPVTISTNGETWFRYHSGDEVDNNQTIVSLLVKVDKLSPLCSGATLEIENNATYSTSTTLNFNWSGFDDNLSGISGYYHNWVNNEYTAAGTWDPSSPGSRGSAAQGLVYIYVWARDSAQPAGNIGCSVTDSIIVDSIAPLFSNHVKNNITEDSPVNLTVNATINDATLNVTHYPKIRYRYGSGSWSLWYNMSIISYNGTGGNYTYEIPEPSPSWNEYRHQYVYWEINATDYVNNSDVSTLQSEKIDEINDPPILFTISNHTTTALLNYTFNITANDTDNDGIDFHYLSYASNESNLTVQRYNNTLAIIWWNISNDFVGTNIINFSVYDNGSPVLTDWQLVWINISFVNEPPILDPIPNLYVNENTTLYYDVNATDPNNDSITFFDNTSLFDIDPITGEINFAPNWSQVGNYSINISVEDNNSWGNLTDWQVITLFVVNVQNNLTFYVEDRILGTPLPSILLKGGSRCIGGCAFDYNYSFIEPNGNWTYNFSKPGFKDNVTDLEVYFDENYTITMDDNEPPELSGVSINYTLYPEQDNFNITVRITATDNFMMENVSFNYTLEGQGVYEANVTNMTKMNNSNYYNFTSGPYNKSFLMISNITALDIYGNSRTFVNPDTHYIFAMGALKMNYPPSLNFIDPQFAPVGEFYSFEVKAFDPNRDNLTYWTNSTIFNISNVTGYANAWINFTPSESDSGVYSINISVSDMNFTDWQTVQFTVEKGNNVTFFLRDYMLDTPLDDVEVTGGVACFYGCSFDDNVSFKEQTGVYNYTFTKQGYQTNITEVNVFNDLNQTIKMTDITPPQAQIVNITGVLRPPENRTYTLEIYANVTDQSQVQDVEFLWTLEGGNYTNKVTMQNLYGTVYNVTLGPFNETIQIDSALNVTDIYNNYGLRKNYPRQFFFESGFELREPYLVITKNIVYVSHQVMNVTYRIEETIYNTAGDDMTGVRLVDTDLNASAMYIDIPRYTYKQINKTIVVPKAASSTTKDFVGAVASIFGKDFYSNAPSILIPGYGGPFDLIFDINNIPSGVMATVRINMTNQNPEFGQDAILYFWLENQSTKFVHYQRQETLLVNASSSIVINRSMVKLNDFGTYYVKGNITWPVNQIAFAMAQFQVANATCFDGIKNGDETGIDCGGSCPPCPGCDNGVMDEHETDVDCGGLYCPRCPDFFMCNQSSDCISRHCVNGICVPATCKDGIQNQGETDIDCGGEECLPCIDGLDCRYNRDCVSYWCDRGVCSTEDHCYDGRQNQDESDVDCGGVCIQKCKNYQKCFDWADCESERCELGICLPQTCNDNIRNQDETGIDCGGSKCPPCKPAEPSVPSRPVEPEYVSEDFGNTSITVSDDASVISLQKNVSKYLIKYGDEIDVSLIIRNFYTYYQTAVVEDTIPPGFLLVDPGSAEVQGNTLSWNLDLRTDPSRIVTYKLKYNERYLTTIEGLPPEKIIDGKTVIFFNKVRIRRIRPLVEKLFVEKIVEYLEDEPRAKLTMLLKNKGDLLLEELYIKDHLGNGTVILEKKNIATIKDDVWYLPELEPEEKEIIIYETGINDDLELQPEIAGVNPENVEYNLIVKGEPSKAFVLAGFFYFMSRNWWWMLIILIVIIIVLLIYLNYWYRRKYNVSLGDTILINLKRISFILPKKTQKAAETARGWIVKKYLKMSRKGVEHEATSLAQSVETLIRNKLDQQRFHPAQPSSGDFSLTKVIEKTQTNIPQQQEQPDTSEYLKTTDELKQLLDDLKGRIKKL